MSRVNSFNNLSNNISVSINKKNNKLLPSYPLLSELFLLVSCVKCLCQKTLHIFFSSSSSNKYIFGQTSHRKVCNTFLFLLPNICKKVVSKLGYIYPDQTNFIA